MLEIKGSWRTTAGAIGIVLSTIAYVVKQLSDGDPTTNIDFTMVMAGLSGAWAAWKARDNKVSSEQAGAGIIPPK